MCAKCAFMHVNFRGTAKWPSENGLGKVEKGRGRQQPPLACVDYGVSPGLASNAHDTENYMPV